MTNKTEEFHELDLLQLIRMLWKRRWALAFGMLLGGILFLGATVVFITPTYKASVLMYVNSSDVSVGGEKVSISQGELTAAKSLIDTYGVILKTRTTLDDVIEKTGVSYTYEQLADMISAASVNATEVFQINVVTPNASEAANIANTIALVLPEKIASIVEGSSARVVDRAVEPDKIDAPNYVMNFALGVAVGFLLAALAVAVLELLDDKIHGSDELTQTYDLPVLAVVPDLMDNRNATYGYYKAAEKEALR